MKKRLSRMIIASALLANVCVMPALAQTNNAITKENDVTIVNTQDIVKDVRGYKGETPVKIYIKNNKVIKVEALPNKETPRFFKKLQTLLTSWDGLTINKASKLKPDAVTGATSSSKAVIKNVEEGLKYYKKNK